MEGTLYGNFSRKLLGNTQKRFIQGGSAPWSKLLPFYSPVLIEKLFFVYLFHIPTLVPCIPLNCCKLHCLKYTQPRPQDAISWIWRWGGKSEKNPERYLDFFTAIKCVC